MREWLLNARKEKKLTQSEMAKKLDISEAYYSYIEAGIRQKNMDITLVSKLSSEFNIPIETIVELEKSVNQ